MNKNYHLIAQLILIYSIIVSVAHAESDTDIDLRDHPDAAINKMYATFKSDIQASAELKTCNANALQNYTLKNIEKYVLVGNMIDWLSFTPLRKTPPKHLGMTKLPASEVLTGSNQSAEEMEAGLKRDEKKRKEYEAFHNDLNHEFTKFLVADNQSALVALCQSKSLKVIGIDQGVATSGVDIMLTNKSNKNTEARLLVSRTWEDWRIADVVINQKRLSDKYSFIFAKPIESTGLYGLMNALKEKNAASKGQK